MATRGIKASGGTDFETGQTIDATEMNTDLNNLISAVNNPTIADSGVISGANIDPSKIGDYSADDGEYQNATAPASRDTANPGNYTTLTTSKPTNLEGELARIRYVVKEFFAGIVSNTTGLPVANEWYSVFGKGVLLPWTGMIVQTFASTAPPGWILLDDGTIGNAASGATTRDHTDTRELYRMFWRMYSDTICPVSSGRGADPDADFAANKTIRLPLMVSRVLGVAGTPAAANITSSYSFVCSGTGSTTSVVINTDVYSPMDDDTFNGYTLLWDAATTTVALRGLSYTITDYTASSGTFTMPTMAGTPVLNDVFTVYKTLATRASGDSLGLEQIVLAGDHNGDINSTGGDGATAGFANGTGVLTAFQPTFFCNFMCKL